MAPETLVALAPDVADSLGDYLRAWWKRIRGGESGAIPIIIGLIVICVFFEVKSSAFFSSANIVNLFVQAAFIILLGMAELYALILSEIDLSVGFVGAVGAAIALGPDRVADRTGPGGRASSWAWPPASSSAPSRARSITRLRIPSFVVTLAGLLGWQGVLIYVFDTDKGAIGGVINVTNSVIDDLVSGNMTPAAGWIVLVVAVGLFALTSILTHGPAALAGPERAPAGHHVGDGRRRRRGGHRARLHLQPEPRRADHRCKGCPGSFRSSSSSWSLQSFMLARTRLGRYMYAIGASPEAARRAGIHVARVRTITFALCSFIAGLAVVVYASRLGSLSVGFDGGTYVLYAVAAAVIGGASLLRRARQADPPGARWTRHRHADQRAGASQRHHRRDRHADGRRPARRRGRRLHAAAERSIERGLSRSRRGSRARRGDYAALSPRASIAALLTLAWSGPVLGSTTTHRRGCDRRGPSTTATPPEAAPPRRSPSVDCPSPAWTSPTLDGELYGEPLVSGGRVFVATENDTVVRPLGGNGRGGVVRARRHARAGGVRSPAATSLPPSGSPARPSSTRPVANSSSSPTSWSTGARRTSWSA